MFNSQFLRQTEEAFVSLKVLAGDIFAPRGEDSSPRSARSARRIRIHKEGSLFVVFVSFVVANLAIWLRPETALGDCAPRTVRTDGKPAKGATSKESMTQTVT